MPGSKERAIRPDRASVGTGRVLRVRDDLPVQVRENCCPQTDAGVSACVRARPCGHARIVVRPLGYYDEARPANIHIVLLVIVGRSEEHTSELQSLMRSSYAVFCLKQKIIENTYTIFILKIN